MSSTEKQTRRRRKTPSTPRRQWPKVEHAHEQEQSSPHNDDDNSKATVRDMPPSASTLEPTVQSSSSLFEKSAQGASILVSLNIAQRVLSFVLNTLLVRHVSLRTYGWISNDMELLHSLILFVSREAVRKTALREDLRDQPSSSSKFRRVVGLSWFSVILGLTGSLGWGLLHTLPYFEVSPERLNIIWLYCLSAAVESMAEPFVVLSHNLLNYTWQAVAEIAGSIVRCVLTYGCFVWLQWGELSFGCAQIMYAVSLLTAYVVCFYGSRYEFSAMLPKALSVDFVTRELKDIVGMFLFHEILAWVLSNGDRILMSSESSYVNKGVYSAAANYSGLIPRMLFSPVEEAARNLFTKLHSQAICSKSDTTRKKKLNELYHHFCLLMSSMSIIGIAFATFGPAYTHLLTRGLLGSTWADKTEFPLLLGSFCAYMTVMSVNGIAEAFNAAVGNKDEVQEFTRRLLVLLVPYLLVHHFFLQRYGPLGLVIAMSLQMLFRSLWALKMAYFWFLHRGVQVRIASAFPSSTILATLCAAYLVSILSSWYTYSGSTISLFVPLHLVAVFLGETHTHCYVETSSLLQHLAIGVLTVGVAILVFTTHEWKRVKTTVQLMKKEK